MNRIHSENKNMLVLLCAAAWLSLVLLGGGNVAAAAEATTTTNESWSTHLHVQLTNDYQSFSIDSCRIEAFENLRAELFSWVQDELLSIFGTFSNLSEFEYTHDPNDVLAKHVPLEATYGCKACGKKQWSADQSMHNVAFLLQWLTQMVRVYTRDPFVSRLFLTLFLTPFPSF
jgi:hypothetical protein